jgi:hypothetical protein
VQSDADDERGMKYGTSDPAVKRSLDVLAQSSSDGDGILLGGAEGEGGGVACHRERVGERL